MQRNGFHGALISALGLLVSACGASELAGSTAASWRDAVASPGSPQGMPAAGTPEFFVRAAQDRAYAEGRGLDQDANPDYIARTAPLFANYLAQGQPYDHPFYRDPFRTNWAGTRGEQLYVEFRNRYGATLTGEMWRPALPFTDPVTGEVGQGPLPAVLLLPGRSTPGAASGNDHFAGYENQAQQLAENGYIVLGVNPQGQGASEYFEPPHPMCDPAGAWTAPQELGLRELGECAGGEGPIPPYGGEYAALYAVLGAGHTPAELGATILQAQLEPAATYQFFIDVHDQFRPRFVFAALDGVAWLLSTENPWRALIDESRIGIVGHSAGADAAMVAGNGDPQRRFRAVVSWDVFGLPSDAVQPSVPTLIQYGEDQNLFGPYLQPPAAELRPSYRIVQRFMNEGVDAALLGLRGSTHQEWLYFPYRANNPELLFFNASSLGGQVAHYYTLAWLDLFLKAQADDHVLQDDARRRLTARVLDGSADRTSIGQGTFDLQTLGNAPYRVEGANVADLLSVFLHSQLAFEGLECRDWQSGC